MGLYDLLITNLSSKPVMISKQFTSEYKCCRIIGLPALRWVEEVVMEVVMKVDEGEGVCK